MVLVESHGLPAEASAGPRAQTMHMGTLLTNSPVHSTGRLALRRLPPSCRYPRLLQHRLTRPASVTCQCVRIEKIRNIRVFEASPPSGSALRAESRKPSTYRREGVAALAHGHYARQRSPLPCGITSKRVPLPKIDSHGDLNQWKRNWSRSAQRGAQNRAVQHRGNVAERCSCARITLRIPRSGTNSRECISSRSPTHPSS